MHYFFHISYLGTNYAGWQIQNNTDKTVQGVLQEAIRRVLKNETIQVNGCGRTDSGVHAAQFYCSMILDRPLERDFVMKMNYTLPSDIILYEDIEVSENAHSRFDATSRKYDYFLIGQDDPLLSQICTKVDFCTLNLELLNKTSEMIAQATEFRSFCRTPDKHNTTICSIHESGWKLTSKGVLRYSVSANRFLKSMIRILVYTQLKVASNEWSIDVFEKALSGKNALPHLGLAPPQGLHLSKVHYPYLNRPVHSIYLNLIV